MYYVYVLKSLRDNNYYFGHSKDPYKRLNLHNLGRVKSTKSRKPLKLIGTKRFNTRNEARWFEYMLKKHGDRKKKLISEMEAKGLRGLRPVGLKPNGLRPGGR